MKKSKNERKIKAQTSPRKIQAKPKKSLQHRWATAGTVFILTSMMGAREAEAGCTRSGTAVTGRSLIPDCTAAPDMATCNSWEENDGMSIHRKCVWTAT